MKYLENVIYRFFKIFTSIMLIFASILIFTDVLSRYLIGKALGWSEELLRYLLIWMTFLGTYLGVKEDEHMGIRIFFDRIPVKWRAPIKGVADILTIVLFLVFTILSMQYVFRFWVDLSPLLEIPMGLIYLVMVIGGSLLIFQIVFRIFYRDK